MHAPAKDGSIDLKKIEEEEQISRKIITKIMRERRNQRASFNAQDAQLSFLDGLAKDEEVSDYQRRQTSGHLILSDGIISPRGGIDTSRTSKSNKATSDRNYTQRQRQEHENNEQIKALKKKQHEYVEHQLHKIRQMVNTPVFVNNYYHTRQGSDFSMVIIILFNVCYLE